MFGRQRFFRYWVTLLLAVWAPLAYAEEFSTGLTQGTNLVSVPLEIGENGSCYEVVSLLGGQSAKLSRINAATGTVETCSWAGDASAGVDFQLQPGEGYILEVDSAASISLSGEPVCPGVDLVPGVMLIGVSAPKLGESCFTLLNELGGAASSLERLNQVSATFEACFYQAGEVGGNDFPIESGVAYAISVVSEVSDLNLNDTADTVQCPPPNRPPNAVISPVDSASVGQRLALSGANSFDEDGDTLTYLWNLVSQPPGSSTALSALSIPDPQLFLDATGEYVLELVVSDGALPSLAASISITAAEPVVEIVALPERGGAPLNVEFDTEITGGFPPFEFAWDLNGDGSTDDERPAFGYTYTESGSYDAAVVIQDAQGFSFGDVQSIVVAVAPQVSASATPSQGVAPLTVVFNAIATDPDGEIVDISWDFQGDGNIDASGATLSSVQHTYNDAGLYEAVVMVTDGDGLKTSQQIVISVGIPPVLNASAGPLAGNAPLEVTFAADATDEDGQIQRYEWDFDGDGEVDFVDATSGNTTHVYTSGGIFPAVISVFDDVGLVASRTFVVSVAGPPTSQPRAYPTVGQVPLTVTFFSDGTDFDGSPEYYDWDFDGDGSVDQRLIASMNTAYTYTEPGTYQARLSVVDDDGLVGDAAVEIVVQPGETVSPASIEVLASPRNGGVPLDVTLIGEASVSGSTVVEYRWDYESDGVVDFVEPASSVLSLDETLDVGAYAAPLVADFTDDGVKDLLVGNSAGQLRVYENLGNNQIPRWSAQASALIVDTNDAVIDIGSYAEPHLHDADGDGDQDLFIGNSSGLVYLYQNVASDTRTWLFVGLLQNLDASNIDVGSYANLEFADIDDDGQLEMLVGNSSGNLRAFEPGVDMLQWADSGLLADDTGATIDVGSYAAPLFVAPPSGSLKELLIGNSVGVIFRYTNVGAAAAPVWQNQGAIETGAGVDIDVGSYANATIYEFGNLDTLQLLIGDSGGFLDIAERRPDGWTMLFEGIFGVDYGSYASPAIGDLDQDGDFDLVVGESGGRLYYRENVGSAAAYNWQYFEFVNDNAESLLDFGSYSAPVLTDLDADGDLDMLVGNSAGQTTMVRNVGTPEEAIWSVESLLVDSTGATIDIGSYAAPAVADFDGDGDLDLVIGNSSGLLFYFENEGDTQNWQWSPSVGVTNVAGDPLDVGSYAYPAVFDWNSDGVSDLFVGNSSGITNLYINRSPTGVTLDLQSNYQHGGRDIGSYAAPAAADMDDDGDLDFVVGNSAGLLSLYRQVGWVRNTYDTEGSFQATFTVLAATGDEYSAVLDIEVLPNGSPSVELDISQRLGPTPLTTELNAIASDPDGSIQQYQWDFDGDGEIDQTSTSSSVQFTYAEPGIFSPSVTVVDNDGLTSIATGSVEAEFVFNLSLTGAQFNPSEGQQGSVATEIVAGTTEVTIQIVDGAGSVVKTLVDGVVRTAGTYLDPWSGDDLNGQAVGDGAYYVVLTYQHLGETITIDLRDTTVFEELTPPRTFSASFNPYEGVPMEIDYQIPWPAEVSLYLWTRDNTRPGSTIAPVRTVFLRESRPAGTYKDLWDGFDDNGVAVEPGRQYPVTLWLYRLPDNAMVVFGNKPQITAISASPRYFAPAFNPYASGPTPASVISFEISEVSDVDIEILNDTGLVVRRISLPNRPVGSNSFTWNGRDSEGSLVAPGTYSLRLNAVDDFGNRAIPRFVAVTVRY